MLMASVAVFLTKLLSTQVAINPMSSSWSNFQCLLWSGSCMADQAGVLLWNWEWCVCLAALLSPSAFSLFPLQLGWQFWDVFEVKPEMGYIRLQCWHSYPWNFIRGYSNWRADFPRRQYNPIQYHTNVSLTKVNHYTSCIEYRAATNENFHNSSFTIIPVFI